MPRFVDQSVTYRVRPATGVVARPVDVTTKTQVQADTTVVDVLRALSPAVEGYIKWQEAQAKTNAILGATDFQLGLDPRRPKGFANIGWGYNKGYNIADGEARSSAIISEYTQELARQNYYLMNPNNENEVLETRPKRLALLRDITEKYLQGTRNPDVLSGASEKIHTVLTEMERQASQTFSKMRSEQLQKNVETALAGVFLTEDPEYIKQSLGSFYESVVVPLGASRAEYTALAASMTIKSVQSYVNKAEETKDIEFLRRASKLLEVFTQKDDNGIAWVDIRMGSDDGIPEYPFGKLYNEGKRIIREATRRIEQEKTDELKKKQKEFLDQATQDAISGKLTFGNFSEYIKNAPYADSVMIKNLRQIVSTFHNTWEADDPVAEMRVIADINKNPHKYTEDMIAELGIKRILGSKATTRLIEGLARDKRAQQLHAEHMSKLDKLADVERMKAEKEALREIRDEHRRIAKDLRSKLDEIGASVLSGEREGSPVALAWRNARLDVESAIRDFEENPHAVLSLEGMMRMLNHHKAAPILFKKQLRQIANVAANITRGGGNGAEYINSQARTMSKDQIVQCLRLYESMLQGETSEPRTTEIQR